jgi:adhesin transport system outer membrane protein
LTKALTAYRQQFQIGQRTLLDLLDTENELFQARRAVVNARHDLGIAHARTQASVGNLLRTLDVTRLATESEEHLQGWNEGPDGPRGCPAEPIAVHVVDKDALVQRAMQLAVKTQLIINEQIAREKAAQEAGRPASAPAATAPSPAASAQSTDEQAIKSALEAWRAAWAKRDVGPYLLAYAPDFVPAAGQSREVWERRRREILGRASDVAVDVTDLSVTLEGRDKARTTFLQNYRSASYSDSVRKTLEWQRIDGRWLIVRETVEPASTNR